ncbi:hypothetical protein DJ564_18525 [Pseudomonas sp. 31-12]|nr:hypothetical protein DJ564_18525 [Pseudomonas sp. 31-12]
MAEKWGDYPAGTKPVGAGLLAKTECQSTSSWPDTPPSRASPLPQGGALLPVLHLAPDPRAHSLGGRRQRLQGEQRGHRFS